MESKDNRHSAPANEARPAPAGIVPAEAREGSPPDHPADGPVTHPPVATPPPPARPSSHRWRKWLLLALVVAGLAAGGYFLVPWVITALNTVSTDDAYVNGHVTYVAPRVAGQVTEVLVDDNYRVKAGDVLVRLDRKPYEVQLAIKKSAVETAEADQEAANAQVRALVAQTRAYRFQLQHAIEDVDTQIANLRAAVAALTSRKASLALAKGNLERGEKLAPEGISKEELQQRRESVKVSEANLEQALQQVHAIRAGLGLPLEPPKGKDLTWVPPNLDQDFSSVRQALGKLMQSAAQFGYFPTTWDATPKQAIEAFYKQDPAGPGHLIGQVLAAQAFAPIAGPTAPLAQTVGVVYCVENGTFARLDPAGNLNRIYSILIPKAPAIVQAKAKVEQARSDLAQAELNLSYCEVVSEIDGVVTRRNVNPGNNVQVGQNLMAVRSLTEIWIDANFKETQLRNLRIGQRVRCEVDMYGSRHEFEGRITGFTMGTGESLSLLPPQNATGNFVKIVQRLPVRIELTDYDPDKLPLFIGLSVEPYVYYKEPAKGPHAGEFLQPLHPLPKGPTSPRPVISPGRVHKPDAPARGR